VFKDVLAAFGGKLERIVCGGAALNPEMITGFEDFGISVFEGYGITECSPLAAVTPYYKRKLGSVGPAVPCCELRIDKKGENYHCRHILLRPTFTREELMQPAHELDSIAHLIRVDSLSFADAALRFSDDASSRNNGGIVSNHDVLERQGVYDGARLTATRFLKEDFGQMGGKSLDDYNALMRLKVGEVSNSFQTTDLSGNQLSKIVKLVEIIPAHTASLVDDYIRIEEMALTDKQEKAYRKWLTSKIDGMYVYIDPAYRSDEFEYDGWIK
jgi:peptidyl-prolyl cis-trans isomerase SurA